MPKALIIAKAALINEQGQFLILTRSQNVHSRPGELDLPGGSVESGEGYDEAVLREIQEETGLELARETISLVFTATNFYENQTTIRFLYVGRIKSSARITLSSEHDKHAWMDLVKIQQKFSHPVWVDGLVFASEHDLIPPA